MQKFHKTLLETIGNSFIDLRYLFNTQIYSLKIFC